MLQNQCSWVLFYLIFVSTTLIRLFIQNYLLPNESGLTHSATNWSIAYMLGKDCHSYAHHVCHKNKTINSNSSVLFLRNCMYKVKFHLSLIIEPCIEGIIHDVKPLHQGRLWIDCVDKRALWWTSIKLSPPWTNPLPYFGNYICCELRHKNFITY